MHKLAVDRKLKTLMILPILFISTFAVIGATSILPAYATAALTLTPALIDETCPSTSCTHDVGAQFQYTVTASGIGGTSGTLFAFQYQITYNTQILQAVSIDSMGPFFDALLGSNQAIPVSSIDNTNGVVSVAVTSLGPSSSPTATSMVLGVITFSVSAIGRSDQGLVNAILIHNAGGGMLENLPVTTSGGVFSNSGLFGLAVFPLAGSGVARAYPEEKKWSFSGDTVFTPGVLDVFANVNSTGTLPVQVFVRFTVRSQYGSFSIDTPMTTLQPGQLSVVPLFTGFTPVSSSNVVQVGSYHIVAQIIYQQINLDNSLGPVVNGPIQPFHVKVYP